MNELERRVEFLRKALSDVRWPFKDVVIMDDMQVGVSWAESSCGTEENQRLLHRAFQLAGCEAAQVPFEQWGVHFGTSEREDG